MILERFCPMASERDHPKVVSARAFQFVIRPFRIHFDECIQGGFNDLMVAAARLKFQRLQRESAVGQRCEAEPGPEPAG